ncbi:zinc finger protein 277 isoform X2 [Chrysoperla carnea]|nr:zinc finger protein 277 isoform X2 [Chrysoperla carnea]
MAFYIPEAKILEPLRLDKTTSLLSLENLSEVLNDVELSDQKCILCPEEFNLRNNDTFLKHLFEIHRLVIADVHLIADFVGYIRYWRHRFVDHKLEDFCTTMLLDKKPDGTYSKDEKYYLLSDVISEDKTLRFELQQNRLEKVLEQHRKERADNDFQRECWFCHIKYVGSRSGFISHLSESHNMQLGQPEKLVFTTDLLNVIEGKLNNFQCIYCEKIFKDRNVLKEHMRKKMHKRINPEDKNYDKFYLVNYMEIGKTWQNKQKKFHKNSQAPINKSRSIDNDSDDADTDSDWSEWNEEYVTNIHCLFCDLIESDFDLILNHMTTKHHFNFMEITGDFKFYDKIRLVNYIRRQIYLRNCIYCDINIDTNENLQKHMTSSQHYRVPDTSVWNHVE